MMILKDVSYFYTLERNEQKTPKWGMWIGIFLNYQKI